VLYYVTMHMRIWTYAFVFCLRKKKLSENRTNRYVTVKRIFSAILMWSWPQERTNLPVSSRIWNFGWTTQPFSWNGKKGQGLPQLFPCVKRLCFSLFLLMRLMWTSFFLDRESYNSKQKKKFDDRGATTPGFTNTWCFERRRSGQICYKWLLPKHENHRSLVKTIFIGVSYFSKDALHSKLF
jgi:hypothetical protein